MPRSPREGGEGKREREKRERPGDPEPPVREREGAGRSLGAGPRSTCGGSVGGVAKGGLEGLCGVEGSIGEGFYRRQWGDL